MDKALIHIRDIWLVEHSQQQGKLHIQSLRESCNNNRQARREGREGDYQPIAITCSLDSAQEFADELRARVADGREGKMNIVYGRL